MPPFAQDASKLCGRCRTSKPATSEFFTRHAGKRDGLYPYCKACRSAYHYARDGRTVPEPVPNGHKRCTKCSTVKEATTEFFCRHAGAGFLYGLNTVLK